MALTQVQGRLQPNQATQPITLVDARVLLQQLGYPSSLFVNSIYTDRVDVWRSWYKGVTQWHYYKIYNGTKHINCRRRSLKMAKKLCEDKADLLMNEKVLVQLLGERKNKRFQKVLRDNAFHINANQSVEFANALGTTAWVEYEKNGKPTIDYINDPYMIWPISWDNNDVTECAFIKLYMSREGPYFIVSRHLLDPEGNYHIFNDCFTGNGQKRDLPKGVSRTWTKNSPVKMFQINKPNIANNFDEGSPMGISIYANLLDVLKSIDTVYDSYYNEFILGRKRIFVDGTLTTFKDDTGCMQPTFDPNDGVFYNHPGMTEAGAANYKPIVESNLELRVDEHQKALQAQLDILSENGGFGKGYYKFEIEYVQTATAVVSQNSKLYRKIRKDELILERNLEQMARALLLLMGENIDQDLTVAFDDSIIEDQDAIIKRTLLEYQANALDLVEYLQETRKLSKAKAEQLAKEMRDRKRAVALENAVLEIEQEQAQEAQRNKVTIPQGRRSTPVRKGPGQGFRSDVYGKTNSATKNIGDDELEDQL